MTFRTCQAVRKAAQGVGHSSTALTCAGAVANGAGKGHKTGPKDRGSAGKARLAAAGLAKAEEQHKNKQAGAKHEGAGRKGEQAANGSTNGAEAAAKGRHLSKKEKRKLKAAAAAAQVRRVAVG